jgi:competence protein ComEC
VLRFALGVVGGAWLFHQLAEIPPWPWLAAGLVVPWLLRQRCGVVLAGLVAGMVLSHGHALWRAPPALPLSALVQDVIVTGRVNSLVDDNGIRARFVLRVHRIDAGDTVHHGDWRIRVSWYRQMPVQPGETWRLPLRVREVHGYASPGAWDYERWLYWQGIRHTAYVRDSTDAQRLADDACCAVLRLRQALGQALDATGLSGFAGGVVRAVTIGDRSGLDARAREVLQQTGTMHLMAISGLHVSLVAAIGTALLASAWRRVPTWCQRVPARLPGILLGLLAAAAYAQLAGFALPTQRALIMLAVLAVALVLRLAHDLPRTLALAAVAVLAWHPASVVDAGFWLSFGAVAVIAAMLLHTRGRAWWLRAALVHLALGFALWPALAVFGLPAGSVGPLANLVLIPLFGVLVVPLALLGAVLALALPAVAQPVLSLVGAVLDGSWQVLEFFASLGLPDLAAATLPPSLLLLSLLGLALLLAPPGNPLRWLAVPLLAVAFLPRAPTLAHGEFDVYVLDAGQGLSVVVRTARHALVYDTGPAFPSGFSVADAVILPFLRQHRVDAVDVLMLSHADHDHAGGADRLIDTGRVRRVIAGEAHEGPARAEACAAGQGWSWDGVDFSVLYPPAATRASGNDASCVLRIDNGQGAILLTGDIETAAEAQLVAGQGDRLGADVVFAPHHGSRSSSTPALVAATRPRYVVYAAGWANRYGFPHADVQSRWRAVGAQALNTARSGTLSLRFRAAGLALPIGAFRQDRRRFWHHEVSAQPDLAVSSAD